MKKNLKMFLLIAVCAMASCCLLYIREADEKQQIHSEKKEKEKLVFLTSKRETRHIFEKIIADFNANYDTNETNKPFVQSGTGNQENVRGRFDWWKNKLKEIG